MKFCNSNVNLTGYSYNGYIGGINKYDICLNCFTLRKWHSWHNGLECPSAVRIAEECFGQHRWVVTEFDCKFFNYYLWYSNDKLKKLWDEDEIL